MIVDAPDAPLPPGLTDESASGYAADLHSPLRCDLPLGETPDGVTTSTVPGPAQQGMGTDPQRDFIRHTVDVPLEVKTLGGNGARQEHGFNVSFGGLAFTSDVCLTVGDTIELRIPTVDPPFEAHARVAWCQPEGDRFLVGAEFLDANDAFRSRMVQQVCAIENYRREVERREGRSLDSMEAAAEWIAMYAEKFPESNKEPADG